MSTDEKVAKDLVETLKDGETGFTEAADKLKDSEHAAWASAFTKIAQERGQFASEIVALGAQYGDDVDNSGSIGAALHRGWMSLKDALTGDDSESVLKAVLTGEDHAVKQYEDALKEDITPGLREVVARQQAAVLAARDQVRALSTTA